MADRDPGGTPGHAAGRVAEPDPATARGDVAADPAPPVTLARTTTLDDPLTTSLLAEVARRSQTIEVSPEQIDEAIDASEATTTLDDPQRSVRR
jgi:hypothetical protein